MLSFDLYREIRPEFLRLLGTSATPLYLDAADALERESALRAEPITRDEALALVERAIERHAHIELDDAAGLSIRERARTVVERLCAAGWLKADDRADYRRFIVVESSAVDLLEGLRKIARPGAAVFSDNLVSTCNQIANEDVLRVEPWQTIEACAKAVRQGLQELNSVAKSVERHTRLQLEAKSLRENLAVIFDEYSSNVGRGAYSELVRSRLPTRLPEAREALDKLQNDPELRQKMADELQRRDGSDPAAAMAQVRARMHDLSLALDRVVPLADEVDRRTADFTRKSLARFRYLQEVTGENRATAQAFFEKLNSHFAGRRVVDAETEISELPALLIADVKLLGGLESLRFPSLRAELGEVEPLDEELGLDVLDRTQRQLAATLRDSLTVARANRFAVAAFEQHGPRVISSKLLRTDDDLADLIACLLHANAREAKYRVEIPRNPDDETGDHRVHDPVLGGTRQLERFHLIQR